METKSEHGHIMTAREWMGVAPFWSAAPASSSTTEQQPILATSLPRDSTQLTAAQWMGAAPLQFKHQPPTSYQSYRAWKELERFWKVDAN